MVCCPRTASRGVLTNAKDVAAQAVRLAKSGLYDTLCLHGDTPGAVTLAQAARRALASARGAVAAFAG